MSNISVFSTQPISEVDLSISIPAPPSANGPGEFGKLALAVAGLEAVQSGEQVRAAQHPKNFGSSRPSKPNGYKLRLPPTGSTAQPPPIGGRQRSAGYNQELYPLVDSEWLTKRITDPTSGRWTSETMQQTELSDEEREAVRRRAEAEAKEFLALAPDFTALLGEAAAYLAGMSDEEIKTLHDELTKNS